MLVDPMAVVLMEALGKLKNAVTSSGIEAATFHLVANQLRYRVSPKGTAVPVTGRRNSHIFYTIVLQMAMRFSASYACLLLPPGRFLVLISVVNTLEI
jgi:hypothetical protein